MLPPGPSLPAILQIGSWIVQPIDLLERCRARFGDVFTLRAPGDNVPFIIVADPELVRSVFSADPAVLLAGEGNATLLEPILGKHSVLTLDGAEHLRQRRLLLPAFHGERMAAFATTMREITEASFATWPIGEPFSLHAQMQSITLDVILRTVFGVRDAEYAELRQALVELLEIAANPWLLFPSVVGIEPLKIPWLRVTRRKQRVDELLYKMIAQRRKSHVAAEHKTDVLAMLLEARDEAGEAMTDVELRDELVTLLLAGHETTATSLAWVFDRLLAHPSALAKLRTELAAGREEYLDAVIRETLRVRPILPLVGRHVAQPFQLGTWTIPVGARIAPSIYLSARRSDAYPDADRFLPERWQDVRKPDPYTWFPFGGGIRRCIGMAFAMFEMKLVLAHVIPRADMYLVDGAARVVRRGITLAPSGGTRVVLERRRS